MAIQRITTPHSERLTPDQFWPQWDEDGYIALANSQMENARKAAEASETMAVQATGTITENMQGETAEAAMLKFQADSAKLATHGGKHSANAAVSGLLAQNVANTKAQINFVLGEHEAQTEAAKVQAVAQGWIQSRLQAEVEAIDDNARQQLETISQNGEQTHEALKAQLNNTDDPSVPPSMPGAPPGETQPALDGLDPDIGAALGGLLGTGGFDPSTMMGMAGMISPLAQSLQSLPGADLANQAGQQGMQALQQLLGQAGGGQAELTPEQVEELIVGQGGSSTDGLPGGQEPGGGSPLENPERPAETPLATSSSETETAASDTVTAAVVSEPSPAAEPVSAAPPTSAFAPVTELSGHSGTATATPAAGPGTHLTGAGGAMGGTATLGAPGMAGGMGGAAAMMGGGMGGAPMMGAPMMGGGAPAQPQAAPRAAAQGQAAQPTIEQRLAAPLSIPTTDPRTVEGNIAQQGHGQPQVDAVAAPMTVGTSEGVERTEPRVRSVMAHLLSEYRNAGLPGDLAIGVMTDGTLVYATLDGSGFIPRGVKVPENVLPLAEFPMVDAQFRAQWTGHLPGAAIATAAETSRIPQVDVIFTTDPQDVGIHVDPSTIRGVTVPAMTFTRELFTVLPEEHRAFVQDYTARIHGLAVPPMEQVTADLIGARGTEYAAKVLVAYLLADAARSTGDDAGYALMQATALPTELDKEPTPAT